MQESNNEETLSDINFRARKIIWIYKQKLWHSINYNPKRCFKCKKPGVFESIVEHRKGLLDIRIFIIKRKYKMKIFVMNKSSRIGQIDKKYFQVLNGINRDKGLVSEKV